MKNQTGAAVEAHLPGGRLEQLLLEWKQARAQRDDLEPRMLLKASVRVHMCVHVLARHNKISLCWVSPTEWFLIILNTYSTS